MTSKLKTVSELAQLAAASRRESRRVVFTNGCFDLLHIGHTRYLQEARALGDLLIVAINSDASVSAHKGPERPLVPEQERAEVLAALACVDYDDFRCARSRRGDRGDSARRAG